MAEDREPYPWTRRDGETDVAWEAFGVYLRQSPRSQAKAAEALGKSTTVINKWAQKYSWVERATAYDRYLETAATDGLAEELVRVRTRHLSLADKLLDHLERRLDDYIAMNADPSVRWTQAFGAATRAQEVAVRLRETKKESGLLERAMELLERLDAGE